MLPQRLSRLFLSQLALNSAFGLVIGTGLWFIGIPSAVLWGILAGILRFVPYIGVFIAAVFPLALAVAVDPGWSLLMWCAALFLIVEPLVGQVIEPLLYGRSTGLSPVAVVVSATFWTALWGPIGLVLATPLTICLVVLGRHVENLKFLEVMFGDRPPLSPPQLFYQRMLAEDPAEALDNAEQFLKERPLAAYYDEVVLKGLKLAQADLDRGALDALHLQRIKNSVIELVKELEDHEDQPQKRQHTRCRSGGCRRIPSRTLVSIIFQFLQKTSLRRIGGEKLRFYVLQAAAALMKPLQICSLRSCPSMESVHASKARTHYQPQISSVWKLPGLRWCACPS